MRAWRLGHPVFTGSVAVLALNDHVFKPLWPGPITGKLSDVAGVVVVAVLLSVAFRARAAVVVTALAFAALKVMPQVALAAAPVLGGVTRTDATDLVALVALVPLWPWLRDGPADGSGDALSNGRRALAAAGIIAAVYTATATSCLQSEGISGVAVHDGVVYAFLNRTVLLEDGDHERVYESHDDGETWTESRSEIAFADQTEACTDTAGDGQRCWRVRPEHGVDECSDRSRCHEVFAFTGEQRRRMRCQESCQFTDDFVAVAVLDEDGGVPIVAMGAQGVLVGETDGSWTRHAVGPAEPLSLAGPPAWTERLVVSPVALGLAGLVVLMVGAAVNRMPFVWAGLAMSVAFVPLIIVAVVTSFDKDGRWPGIVITTVSLAVFAVSLVTASRSAAEPRVQPPPWPPPPGPPPVPFS